MKAVEKCIVAEMAEHQGALLRFWANQIILTAAFEQQVDTQVKRGSIRR